MWVGGGGVAVVGVVGAGLDDVVGTLGEELVAPEADVDSDADDVDDADVAPEAVLVPPPQPATSTIDASPATQAPATPRMRIAHLPPAADPSIS